LIPLMLDPVNIPPYGKLIQSLDVSRNDFWEQLWPALDARLAVGKKQAG